MRRILIIASLALVGGGGLAWPGMSAPRHAPVLAHLVTAAVPSQERLASHTWAENLYLGLDGVWARRAMVEVVNDTAKEWTALSAGVGAGALGAVGARAVELRLQDESGVDYRVGVWRRDRAIDEGTVSADDTIIFPATVAAHARRRFVIYWNNPRAWGLAERWRSRPKVSAQLVAKESLAVTRKGEAAPWPKNAQGFGTFRVPIVVANLSAEDRGPLLATFLLADAIHGEPNPDLELTFDGRRTEGARFGVRYVFPVDVPAHTVLTYYLYVRPKRGAPTAEKLVASGILSEILSDQAAQTSAVLPPAEERSLLKIAASALNGVSNAALEDETRETKGWDVFPKSSGGVVRRVAETGGIVGPRCVEQTVAPSDKPAWHWFGVRAKVKPGRDYFCGAFARATDLKVDGDGVASLYFTEYDAAGKPIKASGGKSVGSVSGTTDWTDLWCIRTMQPAAATFDLYLSSRATGTSALDCAIVAEHIAAGVGERAYPPEAHTRGLVVCRKSNTEKVFPERPIENDRPPWRVQLARGESENLQLAVRSGAAIASLRADVTELEPPAAGLSVAPLTVELVAVDTPVGYGRGSVKTDVLITPHIDVPRCDGWRGLWPDPLVRTNALTLAAETTRAFQFEFRAAETAKPGVRKAKIRWSSNGRVLREDPIEIEVWNFTVPERPTFCAGYDIRYGSQRCFRAPGEKDLTRATERVTQLMAEYKIAPTSYYEGKIFSRDAAGRLVADFTAHDAAAKMFFEKYRFPDAYFPRTPFYCFGVAGKPCKFLGEEPYEPDETDRAKLRPQYVRTFQEALRLYWNHMKEKGWADRVVLYISDEPRHWTKPIEVQMRALCDMIHAVDPKIPIYSSTWQLRRSWLGHLDVWGGGSYGCFSEADRAAVRAAGGRLWFTTDGQMCIDTPACAIEQLLPLYAACYGVEKYEFWGANWVTHDPWRWGWHAYVEGGVRFPNGDGFILYPPRDSAADPRPCASVRLVAARDGVELYTYFKLLEDVAGGKTAASAKDAAEARRLADVCRKLCVIPNAGGRRSTQLLKGDANVLERWRTQAGNLLSNVIHSFE